MKGQPAQPCDRREFLRRAAAWAAGAAIPCDPGTFGECRPDLLDARFRQLLDLQGSALVHPAGCSFWEFALVGPGGRDDRHRRWDECLFVDLPPSGFCLGLYDFDPPAGWRRAAFALGFRPKEQVTPVLYRPDYLALDLPTADDTMGVAARFFRLVGEGQALPTPRPPARPDEELLALAASVEKTQPGRLLKFSDPFQRLAISLGDLSSDVCRTRCGWRLQMGQRDVAGRTIEATRKKLQGALGLSTRPTTELREYDEPPTMHAPGIHVFECRLETAAEVLAFLDRLLLA